MPKEEWGIKRVCPTTGKRFYDLNRTPIISPYTGEIVQIEQPGRKSGPLPSAASKVKKPVVDDLDSEDVLLDDDDIAVEADDELLEDDDDTVSLDDLSDVPDEDDDV